jgi:hypothetical protein
MELIDGERPQTKAKPIARGADCFLCDGPAYGTVFFEGMVLPCCDECAKALVPKA